MESVTLRAILRPAVRLAAEFRPAAFPPLPETYAGTYAAVPAFAKQILPAAGKIMSADVSVEAIPYAELPNAGGGLTAVIGGA